MTPTCARASRSGRLLPLATGLVYFALAVATWRKWPDTLVDFGRELYVPWQITAGRVLYRDLDHLYGPLSAYVNAGAFVAAGVSVQTLTYLNLAILLCIAIGIHHLFARATTELGGAIAALTFGSLFGFAQYTDVGNYNYVAPYSHEATHGVLLTVLFILAFSRHADRPRASTGILAGICLGATLLTRLEIAVAACGTAAIALCLLALPLCCERARIAGRTSLQLFLGASILPALALAGFSLAMPPAQALRAAFAAVNPSLVTTAVGMQFFQASMGTDAPGTNLGVMLGAFISLAAVPGAALLASRAPNGTARRFAQAAAGIVAGVGLIFVARAPIDAWSFLFRALPLTSAAAALWLLGQAVYQRRSGRPPLALCLWSVWAVLLILKISLHARVIHYGFYLAMPSVVLLAVLAVEYVPTRLARARPDTVRGLALIALGLALVAHVSWSMAVLATKTLPVGRDGDVILGFAPPHDTSTAAIRDALAYIDAHLGPNSTFVAFPEAEMLNFLSRRANPTPYVNYPQARMLGRSDEDIIATLTRLAPGHVVLAHRDAREHGIGNFGTDPRNGAAVLRWIRATYELVARFGVEPFTSDGFGIEIWRRRA